MEQKAEITDKDRERVKEAHHRYRSLYGTTLVRSHEHGIRLAQLVADVREERDKEWDVNRVVPTLLAELAVAKTDLEQKDYGDARIRLLAQIQEHVPETLMASGLVTGVQVCVNLIVDLKAELAAAKADLEKLRAERSLPKCDVYNLRDGARCILLAHDGYTSHVQGEPCPNLKAKTDTERLQSLVDKQAEDEGLWFAAQTAPEAYLQQELRKLHEAIDQTRGGDNDKTTP